jgi:hypothetical protein
LQRGGLDARLDADERNGQFLANQRSAMKSSSRSPYGA